MFEEVGEDDDVERPVRNQLEGVTHFVLHARVAVTLFCLRDVLRREIDAKYGGMGFVRHIVRQRSDAASDIEHSLV